MDKEFYVRWKSKVTGPFSIERIVELLSEGQLSKHHQVSEDRGNWTALCETPEFLAACGVQKAEKPQSEVSTITRQTDGGQAETEKPTHERRLQLRVQPIKDEAASSTTDSWYYASDGEAVGPMSIPELAAMAGAGDLERKTPICREGEESWRPAVQVFPEFWRVTHPAGHVALRNPRGARSAGYVYAGFWLRLCASVVDGILGGLLAFAVQFAVWLFYGMSGGLEETDMSFIELLGVVASSAVWWLYYSIGESSVAQGTLGKRAFGLRVTDLNGERISFGRATGRYLGKILSGLILGIGYLMAGFTEQKQALHDMLAGTLVIKQ